MSDPRLASADDLAPAAETLAQAFAHYPWTRHVIPEEGYDERLLALQRLYLAHAHRNGIVAVTRDRDGVIALLPPDAPEPDDVAVEQIVALHGDRIGRLTNEAPARCDWRPRTSGTCDCTSDTASTCPDASTTRKGRPSGLWSSIPAPPDRTPTAAGGADGLSTACRRAVDGLTTGRRSGDDAVT